MHLSFMETGSLKEQNPRYYKEALMLRFEAQGRLQGKSTQS